MKRSDSFIVTVDDNSQYHIIDKLEVEKYALKAETDIDGSKQIVDDMFKQG